MLSGPSGASSLKCLANRIEMQKLNLHCWCVVLSGLLLGAGCTTKEDVPPQELTLEEINEALAYLKQSGKKYPASVYDLTNLPALQGKVFPILPEGQYYSIDKENGQVIVEIDRLPDMPDAFPHRGSF